MILVTGWVRLAPGSLETLRPAALTMAQASRAEPGCLAYEFATDLGDPDLVRLHEAWRDQDALTTHFQTPHMAAFNAALGQASILAAHVEQHEIAQSRDVLRRP